MGGNGRNKKGPNATTGFHPRISMTLREEASGKKHGNVNAKTMCKVDHLKNLALWAATEASVPSLGAFLGERLAATTDALNLRADPSMFICGRVVLARYILPEIGFPRCMALIAWVISVPSQKKNSGQQCKLTLRRSFPPNSLFKSTKLLGLGFISPNRKNTKSNSKSSLLRLNCAILETSGVLDFVDRLTLENYRICESILKPGSNCTVRIEKNKSRTRHHRRKKSHLTTQNNVVYRCHFCSHQNLMRGTPKGYLREICPAKAKPPLKLETSESSVQRHPSSGKTTSIGGEVTKIDTIPLLTVHGQNLETSSPATPLPIAKPPLKLETSESAVERHPSSGKATTSIGGEVTKIDTIHLPTVHGQNLETSSPTTPLPTSGLSLLDSKRRKRNRSHAKKVVETETSSNAGDAEKSKHGSGKRRKRSWTSLKEIAESGGNENSKKLTSFTVPFLI
ncbi:hypothetical protein OROMI_020476 [Orobanche minor]